MENSNRIIKIRAWDKINKELFEVINIDFGQKKIFSKLINTDFSTCSINFSDVEFLLGEPNYPITFEDGAFWHEGELLRDSLHLEIKGNIFEL